MYLTQPVRPIPRSTQELAIDTRADQTLFCGTRGCGKTAAQLLLFRRMVAEGCASPGIVLDVEYKALDNLVLQAIKLFRGHGRFNYNKADYFYRFNNGQKLFFRTARSGQACESYLGHSYSLIAFNELTKWPLCDAYDVMMGSLRDPSGHHTKVFSTTNPFGLGKQWCKRRFIDPVPYGVCQVDNVEVSWGRGKKIIVPKKIIALRSNYMENPYFTPQDVANLEQSCRGDPARLAAWIHCDWDAAGGDGAINDLWDSKVHVLPDFPIPAAWRIDRCMDWGSTHPFSVGWFALANGEAVQHNGKTLHIPRDSVIQFAEWYGCERDHRGDLNIGANKGIRLTPRQVAEGILAREKNMRNHGIIKRTPVAGAADTNISNVHRSDVESIEKTMQRFGVFWRPADKSAGSRANGLQAMRDKLQNALDGQRGGYYVQRRCRATIETLPFLERDGEDIMDEQEDHVYDMTRYRLFDRRKGTLKSSYPLGGTVGS